MKAPRQAARVAGVARALLRALAAPPLRPCWPEGLAWGARGPARVPPGPGLDPGRLPYQHAALDALEDLLACPSAFQVVS